MRLFTADVTVSYCVFELQLVSLYLMIIKERYRATTIATTNTNVTTTATTATTTTITTTTVTFKLTDAKMHGGPKMLNRTMVNYATVCLFVFFRLVKW